jgi:hypothetical protein
MLLQTYLSQQRGIKLDDDRNVDTDVDKGDLVCGKSFPRHRFFPT